jgi:peptidoglycan/xylan/chitin deacetylase (PgdA/CDA1 family)
MSDSINIQSKPVVYNSNNYIKVLMYHRVVDDKQLSQSIWTCIHRSDFYKHMQLLELWGYTPITLNDYRLCMQGELTLPRKPIIITFDDGYLDTYEIAYPIMKEFGFRGVVFVLGDRNIKINAWDSNEGFDPAPLMEDYQIVEMHADGFEIGSHSMTHPELPTLSKDDAWEEISRSRIVLEILLNTQVHSFSYPYGLQKKFTEKLVMNAGYSFACGVYTGPATFGVEPYNLRRIAIRNTTGIMAFSVKVCTPYQYVEWFRRKIANAVQVSKRKAVKSNFNSETTPNAEQVGIKIISGENE